MQDENKTFFAHTSILKVGDIIKVVDQAMSKARRAYTWKVVDLRDNTTYLKSLEDPKVTMKLRDRLRWEIQYVSKAIVSTLDIVQEPTIEAIIPLNAPMNPAHRQGPHWDKMIQEAVQKGEAKVQRKYTS